MANKHGAHQTGEAYVVSLCEDYCKSPSAPVGYMISQKLDMSTLVCGTVNGCGTPVLNLGSRVCNVTGNEAGVGGGIVSGVNIGMCKPVKNYASKVRAEGQFVVCHDTIFEMNCAGHAGIGNVTGKIVYLEKSFDDVPSTKPVPQPAPTPTPAPVQKIGEHTTKNGDRVPIYQDPSRGGTGGYRWDPVNGPSIVLGPDADVLTKANEVAHAESDSRGPGGFDGVGHTRDGKEMTPLENEADSDAASIEAADEEIKKQQAQCDTMEENTFQWGCYFRVPGKLSNLSIRRAAYVKRKQAFEKANELIKQGKLEEARNVLNDYPVYQAKVPVGPSVP